MTASAKFDDLFSRRAFLHWYTSEGMEELEFIEAKENINALIGEYQIFQDMTAEDDEEDLDEDFDELY